MIEGWLATASLLIVKAAGSIVFPVIEPVADCVTIYFVNVGDPINAIREN